MEVLGSATINAQADQMIRLAFDETLGTPRDRLFAIGRQSVKLRPVLAQVESAADYADSSIAAAALRAEAARACAPSLAVVAQSGTHNFETADMVYDRLHDLSGKITESAFWKPDSLRDNNGERSFRQATDEIAKIAVLGVLWWGILNEHWSEKTYALPTPRPKGSRGNGNGWSPNLMVRRSGSNKKHPMVVRPLLSKDAQSDIAWRNPGTTVVAINRLTGNRRMEGALKLLKIIADDKTVALEEIHHRLAHRFQNAETRKQEARQKR